jgi:protein-S-isoprenylcysteine O-methyltransferase Ste14
VNRLSGIHFALRGWISAALLLVLAWARFQSDAELRPTWLMLIAAGAAFRVWAARHILGHSNGHAMAEGPLSTSGPYSWSRHPLYLSNFAVACGLVLFAHCLLPWVEAALLAVTALHYGLLAIAEERFLLQRLGESYARYQRTTPRWLGFPSARAGGDESMGAAALEAKGIVPAAVSAALGRQAANLLKAAAGAVLIWALSLHG